MNYIGTSLGRGLDSTMSDEVSENRNSAPTVVEAWEKYKMLNALTQ